MVLIEPAAVPTINLIDVTEPVDSVSYEGYDVFVSLDSKLNITYPLTSSFKFEI